MKVLAPVNSVESACAQISVGADEIYVGLKTDVYKNYSFSGRGQKNDKDELIVPAEKDLAEIVSIAHSRNVEVSLVANTPLFSDALDKRSGVVKEFNKYVENGIKCGVDNIIVGDIGLLYQLGKQNLPVNIHASTFFDSMNIEQLIFFKELGASRVVLTYQVSLDEIRELCAANIVEIEVFGYMGCSFFNGACNLVHSMGEECGKNGIQLGVPCKATYKVYGPEIEENIEAPWLDAELGCALCNVKLLLEAGVNVIKIVGRDRNYKLTAAATELFRQAVDIANKSGITNYDSEVKKIRFEWWKRVWCEKNRCKYSMNDITKSYIGNY